MRYWPTYDRKNQGTRLPSSRNLNSEGWWTRGESSPRPSNWHAQPSPSVGVRRARLVRDLAGAGPICEGSCWVRRLGSDPALRGPSQSPRICHQEDRPWEMVADGGQNPSDLTDQPDSSFCITVTAYSTTEAGPSHRILLRAVIASIFTSPGSTASRPLSTSPTLIQRTTFPLWTMIVTAGPPPT